MLFSGIDMHKRSVAIHTLDAAGTVVRAANLPAKRQEQAQTPQTIALDDTLSAIDLGCKTKAV